MSDKETKRISRLTGILTNLQSKRLTTASELSAIYNVSIRTIYRDIKTLENSGVPIFTEEGKGYALVEGYRMPPVSFTETEANALITAEQLVIKNRDASFVNAYREAIVKIKSVLRKPTQEKANMLASRIEFRQPIAIDHTSNYLSIIQLALTNFNLTKLTYYSPESETRSERIVEPFALYHTQENWLLIAMCRMRNAYRTFRLDRIEQLKILDGKFKPHSLTLPQYFEICRLKNIHNP